MIPPLAALARVTNSGSRYLKQNSAIAGMLERRTRAWMPEGMMSSVETLSPTLSSTGATSVSSGGAATGTGLMLGPLATSTLAASASGAGFTSPADEASNDLGKIRSGGATWRRGSVIVPVRAEAAATTEEQ